MNAGPRGRVRAGVKALIVAFLALAASCGCPDRTPSSSCLPDWSWCVVAQPDGGAIVEGAP